MKKFLLLSLLSLSALSIQSADSFSPSSQPLPDSGQPSALKKNIWECSCGRPFMSLTALNMHIRGENATNPKPKHRRVKKTLTNSQECKFCKNVFTKLNDGIGKHEEQCRQEVEQIIEQARQQATQQTTQVGPTQIQCNFPGCGRIFDTQKARRDHQSQRNHNLRLLEERLADEEAAAADDNQ